MSEQTAYHWPTDGIERQLHVADVVTYVDELSREHNALVTAIWPKYGGGPPSLNLVHVSVDEKAQDPYGRQLAERPTSVPHMLDQAAPGRYWKERVIFIAPSR